MDRHTPPTVLPVWSSGKASQAREGQIWSSAITMCVLLWVGLLTVLLYGSVIIAMYSINWVLWLSNLNIWLFIPFRDRGRNWAADHGTGDPWQNARTTIREIRSKVPRQYSGSPRNFCCSCFWIHGFAVLTDRGIVAIAGVQSISVLCTCRQT